MLNILQKAAAESAVDLLFDAAVSGVLAITR